MGKSSKKSVPKVDAAPAVVPPSKSAENGKREADDELEKQVSAKKQKRDKVAEKEMKEAKVLNKKESRSDDSSSDSEVDKRGNPASSSCSFRSSDDESDVDDPLKASKERNNSSKCSEDSEEVIEEKPSKTPQKNVKDVEIVDAASTEATGNEAHKSPSTTKEQNATSKTIFVGNLSYSVEYADLDNFFKDCGEIVNIRFALDFVGRFKGFAHVEFATEEAVYNALKLNNNELLRRPVRLDFARERGAYTPNCSNKNNSFQKGGSGQCQTVFVKGFDTSLGEHEPLKASEESNDSSKCSVDSEEEIEEKPSKTPQKNISVKDVEIVDAASTEVTGNEARKSPATTKEQNATSKTIYVGNLSHSVYYPDLDNFFKDCGEIVNIRFGLDFVGRFKGFAHVEFATEEAVHNALKLNKKELFRRPVRLDVARERGAYTSNSRNKNSFQKGGSGQCQTAFVKGFDTSLGEDEIRARLEEHFSSCGNIRRISIPTYHGTGAVKGFAYLHYEDFDGFSKALELHGTDLGSSLYPLIVEEAKCRVDNQGGRGAGGRSGGDQFGGRQEGGWSSREGQERGWGWQRGAW